MKKLIAMLLVLTMAVSMVACGQTSATEPTTKPTTAPTEPTTAPTEGNPTTAPTEPAAPETLSEKVKVAFAELVKANAGKTGEEIAEMLIADELLADREMFTTNHIDASWMIGFDETFAPEAFKKATSMEQSNFGVFLGYVFELNEGTDAAAFAAYLKEHADMNWNRYPADQIIAHNEGNLVLLVMCAENVEPIDFNQILVDAFNECVKSADITTALQICESIAQQAFEKDFPMMCSPMPYEKDQSLGGLPVVGEYIEVAGFGPMMMGVPFAGYVFMLDQNADAEAFLRELKDNADLNWNNCTWADVIISSTYNDGTKNVVMIALCPANDKY